MTGDGVGVAGHATSGRFAAAKHVLPKKLHSALTKRQPESAKTHKRRTVLAHKSICNTGKALTT